MWEYGYNYESLEGDTSKNVSRNLKGVIYARINNN